MTGSHAPSRSTTPSRLHPSAAAASSATRLLNSPSRTHLPQPKVLPFPDLPVRTAMSREHSQGASPLGSPGISPRASYADALAIVTPQHVAAAASASVSHLPDPRPTSPSRLAHSFSPPTGPSASDLGAASRLSRPRAATTAATTSSTASNTTPTASAVASAAASPPFRQEGFLPSPRPMSPIAINTLAAASTSGSGSGSGSSGSAGITGAPLAQSPDRASIPHDPTPPTPVQAAPRQTPVKKMSNPPFPMPASIPVTPRPPPGALVDHLYRSFCSGACADVRLWVRRWNVGWLVHKMVLVQAGFFHSLFMGGFSETNLMSKGKGRAADFHGDNWTGEDIELTFDDPNITRAAFEICLSRLYSQHPQLHFPVALLPTAAHPLTPSFPPTTPCPASLQETHHRMPANTHLVTPRLLLSLLATATYLGQPYLLREVLAILLRTVGPATVGRYLFFAIGDGIGEEEWDGQDDEGARGLEKIARTLSSGFTQHESDEWVSEIESDTASISRPVLHRSSTDSNASDDNAKVCDTSVSRSASMRSNATARPDRYAKLTFVTEEDGNSAPSHEIHANLPHFYGFVSNKIGEACVCWLARWGADVLAVEAAAPQRKDIPPVWSMEGIPARFVSAILSSDALFVPNERQRYHMARMVFDLRRDGWALAVAPDTASRISRSAFDDDGWEEEERELAKTFEDLSAISGDIDPSTGLPYAPLSVLQAAHWAAADLKTRITSGKGVNSADGELGLTQSASEISSQFQRRRRPRLSSATSHSSLSFSPLPAPPTTADALYHPVPNDDTHRIGAGGLLFFNHAAAETLPGIPGMPDLGPEWAGDERKSAKTLPPPQDEKTFFGILRGARRGPEIDSKYRDEMSGVLIPTPGTEKNDERWSKVEPFRFSVEFWGVDKLSEKERLYSQTYFYAGSYFNVYVSTIKKKEKGVQLGIYLHRQSVSEEFPPVSTVASANGSPIIAANEAAATQANSSGFANMYRTLSVSPPVIGSPDPRRNSLPDEEAKESAYLDPREVTKAYFSITCASALGTALVRFSSAPDSFAISQSWGWKSSALRSEEYLSVPIPATESEGTLGWVGESGEGGSLRATVVVGVI